MSDLKREHLNAKIAGLENRRQALLDQRKRANDQWIGTLNQADKTPLDHQITVIDADLETIDLEIEKLYGKLENADAAGNALSHRHRILENHLHRIDYTEVKRIIQDLICCAESDGAASVFLIQKSRAFQGDLCIKAICEELRPHSANGIFRRSVRFTAYDQKSLENLFSRLAGHFGIQLVETSGDLERYAQEIIQRICDSVTVGSITLIEIYPWDEFQENESVCAWFMEYFWVPMITAFRAHPKRINAKLLVLLVANGPCPDVILGKHCKEEVNFLGDKILPLPLRNWHLQEVSAFLKTGVLDFDDEEALLKMTKQIFAESENGMPRLICDSLKELILEEA